MAAGPLTAIGLRGGIGLTGGIGSGKSTVASCLAVHWHLDGRRNLRAIGQRRTLDRRTEAGAPAAPPGEAPDMRPWASMLVTLVLLRKYAPMPGPGEGRIDPDTGRPAV